MDEEAKKELIARGYTEQADGTWIKAPVVTKPAVSAPATIPMTMGTGDVNDPNNYGGPSTFPKAYQSIVETLSDPEVQEAIWQNYQEQAKNIKDPNLRARAVKASKEKVMRNLLQLQKQNYAIANANTNLSDTEDVWDRTSVTDKSGKKWAKNEKYKTTMKQLGFKDDEILGTDDDIAIAQAAFKSTLKVAGPNSPLKDKFAMYFNPLMGKEDEIDPVTGKKVAISAADSWYGNTTAGQLLKYRDDYVPAEKETPVAKTDPVTKAKHLDIKPQAPMGSPWWLQDIVKTAHAAGDLFRTKRYNPWQAEPDYREANVAFDDPTRALAANAEMANMAGQNVAQFTGPQAFNARQADFNARAMGNAANIISDVHNKNISISNAQASRNADGYNRNAENRANRATSLFDKYQMANQNFDYAKGHARNALVNQFTNAITNRANTYNLNQMNPQYAANPGSGGHMYFRNPRDLNPDGTQQTTADQYYETMLEEHPTWRKTPQGQKIAWEAAKLRAGIKPTEADRYTDYDPSMEQIPRYGA